MRGSYARVAQPPSPVLDFLLTSRALDKLSMIVILSEGECPSRRIPTLRMSRWCDKVFPQGTSFGRARLQPCRKVRRKLPPLCRRPARSRCFCGQAHIKGKALVRSASRSTRSARRARSTRAAPNAYQLTSLCKLPSFPPQSRKDAWKPARNGNHSQCKPRSPTRGYKTFTILSRLAGVRARRRIPSTARDLQL